MKSQMSGKTSHSSSIEDFYIGKIQAIIDNLKPLRDQVEGEHPHILGSVPVRNGGNTERFESIARQFIASGIENGFDMRVRYSPPKDISLGGSYSVTMKTFGIASERHDLVPVNIIVNRVGNEWSPENDQYVFFIYEKRETMRGAQKVLPRKSRVIPLKRKTKL